MAAAKHQESSSSLLSHCKYQVFLSFRGEDTRKNFTDHLYAALIQAGIHTFRDDDEIRRGENIELEIQKGIQQSKISIILFSKDYASSRWCLDELVLIMEHRRTTGCMILPVFYDVDPSHVRKQTGSFAIAFEQHEKRFEEEKERVNGWRIALKEVADLAGMVLGEGHEAQFVHSIVENVSKKLDRKIFHIPLHFIGRDSLIDYVDSWLQDESHGAAIIILCGIGGVGKTTIAKSVYNQNFDKFEGRSFLANVRERSKESNGLVSLQRQLLSDILNKTANEIHDVDEGIIKIKDAICCRRSLIVLDDVDKREQLDAIIGMRNLLYRGSKIIVTTRNKGLLAAYDKCLKIKVEPLDIKESLELFSWHAFGQPQLIEEFVELSNRIVRYCNGLPLALRVIGSSLSGKRTEVWASALQKMEVIPDYEVQKVIRISYDSLEDDYQKSLFLDIACFFNGMDEDYAVSILNGLVIGATFRIDNLIDRCLVEINKDKRLWMHQLVRDMGREISRQESPKCQRIWHYMEAFTIFKENIQDTETVRGVTLDMHELREDICDPLENSIILHQHNFSKQCFPTGQASLFTLLSTDAFRKMKNIKFLQLNYVKFHGKYQDFPKSLIWLCWHGFSLRSIPKHFCLDKLVVLDLCRSSLVDVWTGKMSLPKLKILDLRHSHGLTRTPDFSGLPSLEKLILEGCIHLVKIHESVRDLRSLLILNLRNCRSLVELPGEVSKLKTLKELVLDGCTNLDALNIELEQLQRGRLLHKDGIVTSKSYITALPSKLFFRSRFSTRKNSRLASFSFPCSLVRLDLCGTPIRFLPKSIKCLNTLGYLRLAECRLLQTLPELPSNLQGLNVAFCDSLHRVTNLPLYFMVQHCDQLVEAQDLIKLELLQKADLHMFRIMETVSLQMQPSSFQIQLEDNIFNVLLQGNEFLRFYQEEEERLIQNKYLDFSFKISSPAKHRICGLTLFISFSAMSESNFICPVFAEIRNNTRGRRRTFEPSFIPISTSNEMAEILWLSHWKCGAENLKFDDGDEVSISVHTNDLSVQIKKVALRTLCEEEGNNIHEDITAYNSSSNNEVNTAQSSSTWNNQTLGDEHVAKAQIASQIFRNYYCNGRYNWHQYLCDFRKKC